MRINNNVSALNTFRQYTSNAGAANKSMEKLSSGLRINRAGDDAAGLAISEKMRAQIRGIKMASKNSQDAISLVQTAEGALTETHAILQRMNELAVQSASDTNETIDRDALQAEFAELSKEIDDIANNTQFNKKTLLDGTFGLNINGAHSSGSTANAASKAIIPDGIKITGLAAEADGSAKTYAVTYTPASTGPAVDAKLAIGDHYITADNVTNGSVVADSTAFAAGSYKLFNAAHEEVGTVEISAAALAVITGDANAFNGFSVTSTGNDAVFQTGANKGETLGLAIGSMKAEDLGIAAASVGTREAAASSITSVQNAINSVSTQRAQLGAVQNRLEHKINNLNTSSENLQAAQSRIRDIDMAEEMTEFTKNNILLQAAQSMLAQANAQPQGVLQLLR